MAGPFGTLGTIPTLTVAGVVFTDLTTIIVLFGRATAANQYAGLRKVGSQSATNYQITTGKTYTARAGKIQAELAANLSVGFGQQDNANNNFNSGTGPTNGVYFFTEGSAGNAFNMYTAATIGATLEMPIIAGKIAAQKYGFLDTNGTTTGNGSIFGYET